jgi:cell division protein FtsL
MAAHQRHETQATPGILGFASMPIVLVVATMIVGLAALLPLVQSSGATTTVGDITTLQRERDDWQTRLEEEQLKVAQMSSLNAIRKIAVERLQMGEADDIRYITVDAPAPAANSAPSRLLPEEQGSPQTGNSLLDDIVGLLP